MAPFPVYHHPGYGEAIRNVMMQTREEDLGLIDILYGRDNLRCGATGQEVKAEALRQLEIDWREPKAPWGRN